MNRNIDANQVPAFEISLSDLKFHAFHGVLPQENKVGNEFVVTVTIRIPYSRDILDDNLDATISYADLYEIVAEEMHSPKKLLETVAARIAGKIKAKWNQVLGGKITICKSTPPINKITGAAEVGLFF